ncbi:MAG: hypothetical protein IPI22_05720 [Bacteroidetes bacterium]|nr:hypothetical protein [Bacteroidota bacterium]
MAIFCGQKAWLGTVLPNQPITIDTTGNIYATGIFNDDLDFDPGPNNYTLTAPAPWYSAFVLKLNECGAPYTTLNLSFCDSALVNGIVTIPAITYKFLVM